MENNKVTMEKREDGKIKMIETREKVMSEVEISHELMNIEMQKASLKSQCDNLVNEYNKLTERQEKLKEFLNTEGPAVIDNVEGGLL